MRVIAASPSERFRALPATGATLLTNKIRLSIVFCCDCRCPVLSRKSEHNRIRNKKDVDYKQA